MVGKQQAVPLLKTSMAIKLYIDTQRDNLHKSDMTLHCMHFSLKIMNNHEYFTVHAQMTSLITSYREKFMKIMKMSPAPHKYAMKFVRIYIELQWYCVY